MYGHRSSLPYQHHLVDVSDTLSLQTSVYCGKQLSDNNWDLLASVYILLWKPTYILPLNQGWCLRFLRRTLPGQQVKVVSGGYPSWVLLLPPVLLLSLGCTHTIIVCMEFCNIPICWNKQCTVSLARSRLWLGTLKQLAKCVLLSRLDLKSVTTPWAKIFKYWSNN